MTSDGRAWLAGQKHRESLELTEKAAQARAHRDSLVRTLRDEDPKRWSYGQLARAVGCSPELIAVIIKSPRSDE